MCHLSRHVKRMIDAVDVDDEPPGAGSTSASATKATTTAAPGLAALGSAWETTCELIYEDDDAEVFCVRFSPDDRLLASGCGDGVVRVFHVDDGRLAYTLEREGDVTRLPITCLRWRPSSAGSTQNVLLAANADGTVCHWHVTSRKIMHTITEADNQVYALDYAPDGASFATAGKDYAVRRGASVAPPARPAAACHQPPSPTCPPARCSPLAACRRLPPPDHNPREDVRSPRNPPRSSRCARLRRSRPF